MSKQWFLVQTQTGREPLARAQLARQNYQAYLPMTLRTIRHARRMRTERCAYFPGYLFVALDLARDQWRSINGTFGVVRLIAPGGTPLPAPRGLVETLVKMTTEDEVLQLASRVKPGDQVRVVGGPFDDMLAVVHKLPSGERVRVLLSIMNRQIAVDLALESCAPV